MLYFVGSHFVERAIDQLQQVAVHQIKAEVNDGGFVVPALLVNYLLDVQNVLVGQPLQNLDLSDGGDGETHLVLVLEVLHLFQGIVLVVIQIAGFVN